MRRICTPDLHPRLHRLADSDGVGPRLGCSHARPRAVRPTANPVPSVSLALAAPPQTPDRPRSSAPSRIPVVRQTLGSWRVTVERTPFSDVALAARYDRAASGWNRRLDLLGVPRAYRRLFRALLTDGPLQALPTGAWVLDAGVGTGALSLALASEYEAVRPPATAPSDRLLFSAVDRSRAMLQSARAAFDAARLDAAFRCTDLTALPFEDNTFDLVMAGHVIEHLPDPQAALRELVRVLRPGAPLLLLATRRSVLGALVHLQWRTHTMRAADLTHGLEACGVDHVEIITPPASAWLRRASLVVVARKPKGFCHV